MSNNVRIHYLAQKCGPQGRCQMMSFIIETPNHHFIAIDGGTRNDAEYFHGYTQALMGPVPHFDLWILTHPHGDHIGAILEMLHRFPDDFTADKLLYHFPSFAFMEKYENRPDPTEEDMTSLPVQLQAKGTQICVAQVGEVYEVDGVTFEVLRVFDPAITHNPINNSSLVIRMEACGQSVLFIGDLGVEAGDQTMAMVPPEKLKVDFVQMAHHGQSGVEERFYQACQPKACLWSTPLWLWNNDAGQGFNTHNWRTVETRGWMEKLGVKHHFVNKDGTQVITLPYPFEE